MNQKIFFVMSQTVARPDIRSSCMGKVMVFKKKRSKTYRKFEQNSKILWLVTANNLNRLKRKPVAITKHSEFRSSLNLIMESTDNTI